MSACRSRTVNAVMVTGVLLPTSNTLYALSPLTASTPAPGPRMSSGPVIAGSAELSTMVPLTVGVKLMVSGPELVLAWLIAQRNVPGLPSSEYW